MSAARLLLTALLALAALLAPPAARANSPLVADISTYRIAIDAGFTGVRVFIFGARNAAGDVVVVIRGPEKHFTVRKKERVAGIWVNRRQMDFDAVPDFYALAATKPLPDIGAQKLLQTLGIGFDTLLPMPEGLHEKARYPEFTSAFLAYQATRRLYDDRIPLGFMGETLFKANIPFPDTIPKGDYTAEIYLISDGELVGMQSMPIRVEKTGFEATMYDFAMNYSLFYGLLAIAIALAAGYGAGRLFEKR